MVNTVTVKIALTVNSGKWPSAIDYDTLVFLLFIKLLHNGLYGMWP